MQSRVKKVRKQQLNDQQAIQKQLNDDFQVYEYLNQNKLQGNIEEYSKLYNILLVNKSQKRKKYQALEVNYIEMSTDKNQQTIKKSQINSNWSQNVKDYFQTQYEQIKNKVSNQIQVKNNLWKQIVQTKKSLNLLKGDIGHFISRNQSAKILQNKISKVKIVADDQLKRVTMAYSKDKDQIKLRGQMQKKFSQKLQNVSIYEDSTLNRLKKNYLNSMLRKKQIHDRLNYIEKIGATIIQSGDLQNQKNQINRNILSKYQCFKKLKNLIQKIPIMECNFGSTSQQIYQFSEWLKNEQNYTNNYLEEQQYQVRKSLSLNTQQPSNIDSQILQLITIEELNEFQSIFINEYNKINAQIQSSVSISNVQMKKCQEHALSIQKYDKQIQKLSLDLYSQLGQRYILTSQMREQYSSRLKRFIQSLKVIFTTLQYIQKRISYTTRIQYQRQVNMNQISSISMFHNLPNNRQSECNQNNIDSKQPKIFSDKSLVEISKNYVSELYRTYSILVKQNQEQSKLDAISQYTYFQMQQNIKKWLNLIKQKTLNISNLQINTNKQINQSKQGQNEKNHYKKNTRTHHNSILIKPKLSKFPFQTQEQQNKDQKQDDPFNFQNLRKNNTIHRDEKIVKNPSQMKNLSISSNRNKVHSKSQNLLINKNVKIGNQKNMKQAIRIRLLKDLDKDYYKMLKSTLKMEKQNTRKNYQFMRTFKRAKYSSRDQILEEKRFQCSFSNVFTDKKPTGGQIKNKKEDQKKSIFFKTIHQQGRMAKTRNSLRENNRIRINSARKIQNSNQDPIKILKQNVKKMKQNRNLSNKLRKNDQKKKVLTQQSCNNHLA